ncbi:MAG: acyltransferase [Alphaproteobacteria bacterium]|nr:acyltransferase [Alphaproteobacteria bacterium]MDB5740791.1 acyltransferase [Alphaproteobacteria bacterium]
MADRPAKQRFRGLDGLRGVCALTVVLLHSEMLFNAGAIFCHGYLAVDVFFILSGFVICASYDARLANGLGAWAFLKARIVRLAPVYWAGTALCIAAALARSHYDPAMSPANVLTLGPMALMLVPYFAAGVFAYPVNFVAWTLLWELIVNVLFAKWLRRVTTPLLLAAAALLLALATAQAFASPGGWSFGMTGADLWFGGLRALPEFLIGVVLYRGHRAGAFARLPQVTPLLPLAAWLALAGLPPGLSPLVDLGIVTLAAPLLIALLVRGEARAPGWFAPLGAVSYPLYASHLSVIWLAQHTPLFGLDRGPRPMTAASVVLLAVAVGWVIHLLLDPAARPRRVVSGFAPENHARQG